MNNKIVACKHIETETANDYKQLVAEPIEQGFIIQGVKIDGKRGVAKAFADIPVQMCHFHQIAIIKRYLTSRPKLEASIRFRWWSIFTTQKLIKLYQGLAKKRKVKLIDEFLISIIKNDNSASRFFSLRRTKQWTG